MNPSLLISTTPSSPRPSVLFSPFTNPTPLLRLTSPHSTTTTITTTTRRRFKKISLVRNSATTTTLTLDQPTTSSSSSLTPSVVFGGKRELSGVQALVDGLSPPVRLASSVVIVAGALAAGYGLGLRFGGTRNTALGGAFAFGAAGGAAAFALNSCVPEVAAVNLHNYFTGSDDPIAIKMENIENIAAKYGVSKQDEAFNAELCDLYCRFVSSVIPLENEDLQGNEVETIIKFKSALGIDDPDAAGMHVEIGRQIFRQRLETGDRDGDVQ